MNMSVVQVYQNYIDANIAKGVLEEEGIPAFLENENMMTLVPMAGVGQGVRLVVGESDRAKALEILSELNNKET